MIIKFLRKWVVCIAAAILLLGGLDMELYAYATSTGDSNSVTTISGAASESQSETVEDADSKTTSSASLMDETQVALMELEDWSNLLRERSGLAPIEADLQTLEESRVTRLEISVTELQKANGLTPSQWDVELPIEERIDTLRNRLLLVSAQTDKVAADQLTALQQVQNEQQSRIISLEQDLARCGQAVIFTSVVALVALILALSLGGYTIYAVLHQKDKQNQEAGSKDLKMEALTKEHASLRREVGQLHTDVLNLHERIEKLKSELPPPSSSKSDVSSFGGFSVPDTQQSEPPVQIRSSLLPAENLLTQSSREVGRLQTRFDPTLSDAIYLTAGEDYILYEDNTVEYALSRPYGELSSFMRNGLLRMYDIQVKDKVYTYQECKKSGCPSFYLEIKSNLRRAEVNCNSAGAYDLKHTGLLEAVRIS